MSRRRAQETAEERPARAGRVALRLREPYFVRSAFAPAGSLHEFPPQEAERRLKTTELWDRV